jgi:hypothetical protein
VVDDLEANANVEDATLGVFHATTHTFTGTSAVKLMENHRGRAFIKLQQVVLPQGFGLMPVPAPQQPAAPPPPPAAP